MSKLGIDECSLNLNKISKAEGSELGKISGSNVTQIWRRGTRDRKNTKEKPVCVTSKLWRDEQICFTSLSQFSHPLFFLYSSLPQMVKKMKWKKDCELRTTVRRYPFVTDWWWLLDAVFWSVCHLQVTLGALPNVSESGEEKKKKETCLAGGGKCVSHDQFKDERRRAFATLSLLRNYSQSDALMHRQLWFIWSAYTCWT